MFYLNELTILIINDESNGINPFILQHVIHTNTESFGANITCSV